MRLAPDLLLVNGRFEAGVAVEVDGGRIAGVAPLPSAARADPGLVALPGKALLPGTVNAHCHTFQSLLRGLGDDLDFMAWRDRVLYPYSARLDREGIYLGAAFAFAEMLLHGATTCVDFFYDMSAQAVSVVWVHGRPVVRGERLVALDQDALMERVRALTREWKPA